MAEDSVCTVPVLGLNPPVSHTSFCARANARILHAASPEVLLMAAQSLCGPTTSPLIYLGSFPIPFPRSSPRPPSKRDAVSSQSHSPSIGGMPPCFVSDYVVPSPSRLPHMPTPPSISEATFVWGKLELSAACRILSDIHPEIVHWMKYYFTVPPGHCGKSFVQELARLFKPLQKIQLWNPLL